MFEWGCFKISVFELVIIRSYSLAMLHNHCSGLAMNVPPGGPLNTTEKTLWPYEGKPMFWEKPLVLLMAEILHQLIGSLSIFFRVLYIPGGAEFQPSTVRPYFWWGIRYCTGRVGGPQLLPIPSLWRKAKAWRIVSPWPDVLRWSLMPGRRREAS